MRKLNSVEIWFEIFTSIYEKRLANFKNVNFNSMNLKNVNFKMANCKGATFNNANIKGLSYNENTCSIIKWFEYNIFIDFLSKTLQINAYTYSFNEWNRNHKEIIKTMDDIDRKNIKYIINRSINRYQNFLRSKKHE